MGPMSEPHRRLEPFVGTFKTEVTLWMGPGDPIVATGVMVNAFDLGGRFLHQDYRGDQMDGAFPAFEGRGYWGYNIAIGKYEGFWIDNASTCMQTEVGDVDKAGKVWTMVGEMVHPDTRKLMKKRTVIELVDQDHHTMETFFAEPDGKEHKAMAIRYARIS